MNLATENVVHRRRGSPSQLSFRSDAEHDVLPDSIIDVSNHNSWFWHKSNRIFSVLSDFITTMLKSTKTALIAVAILACVVVVILLLNLENITSIDNACIRIDGGETCYKKEENPYRLYGTKTAYHIVKGKDESLNQLNIGNCVPKVFYLFSRHATRYPDREDIEEMIKLLSGLQKKIYNNSLVGKVKMCQEDLQNMRNWTEKLEPNDDNRISATGEAETAELAQRFKRQFPSLLGGNYSPEKFKFEFTSRERTKSTAESFAQGLFGDAFKQINFDNSTNDVLQFNKECKSLQKRCKDKSYNTSEVEKFENGPLIKKVIDSVSSRIGVSLSYGDIKLLHKSCSFGYALDIGDFWCSLFTTDELKVLEFGDDIDDYYSDAYGNKVNYEQACPIINYIIDLFRTFTNTLESKVLLQFAHAGGIKKVYSAFGLFKDEKPMTADNFCSQENRMWQSSYIAPFTTNLALVLYDCNTEIKIAAFHNEIPIKLGGCSEILCPYNDFYKEYNPIAEECDITRICCTCCLNSK